MRTMTFLSAPWLPPLSHHFVAINAWNEWGEGMAIEPSDTYGRGFLEIIRDVKDELREGGCLYEEGKKGGVSYAHAI